MRRVLVCGSRKWSDRGYLEAVLNSLHAEDPFSVVIEGEAPGADRMSREWAKANGVEWLPFPANWDKYGKGAGPIRNRRMLADGSPDLVVAFNEDIDSSSGTLDMVLIARTRGVEVNLFDGRGRVDVESVPSLRQRYSRRNVRTGQASFGWEEESLP